MALKKKRVSTKMKGETKKTKAKRGGSFSSNAENKGVKKEYLKTKKICKVTFRLPRIAAPKANSVCIVGEFNNWNIYATPMKKLKSGDFKITLNLESGQEYQFRYLIDGDKWENDWNADKYVKSPYGDSDNSVIIV